MQFKQRTHARAGMAGLAAAGAVLVAQRRSSGETTFGAAQTVDLKLVQATYEKLRREGIKLTKQFQLEPDAEELRVVVRDNSSGTTGTVFIPLERWRNAP